jgi:ABC-type Na+ efflux pump permease subunit
MTTKDMSILIRKKYTLYTTIILPIALAIGLPLLVNYLASSKNLSYEHLTPFMDAFSFFFLIIGTVIPLTLASYSLVGEKVEKSLEPLLATPTTDSEILFGKFLATFIPCLVMVYIAGTIYMILMNYVTNNNFHQAHYPNTNFDIILFLLVPLFIVYSVEICIILSSRFTDIRSAQQTSYITLIPLIGLYVLFETSVLTMDTNTLWVMAGVIVAIDVVLYFISIPLFDREEILTKWK